MAILFKVFDQTSLREGSVKVDDSSLQISGTTLQIKAAGVTETHLATSVAGNGLQGGAATALSVKPETNQGIKVTSSGVAVDYDNSTVGIVSNKLAVKAAGITETQLNSSVAGNGLTGGAGTKLAVVAEANQGAKVGASGVAVDYDNATIGIVSNKLAVKSASLSDGHIATNAAIVYSKLSLALSIVDADISTTAAISDSKLAVSYLKADGTRAFTGAQSMGGYKLTNVANPTVDTDAATKGYVDQTAITGGVVKESLLIKEQLDTTDGINAAAVTYFLNPPIADDTFVIKNGTTTETFTFKASAVSPFEVTIGATAVTAMTNLAAAIVADSTAWDAKVEADGLDAINSTGVVVVYEKASAAGASASRMYGTWATQADAKVVEYNSTVEYRTEKAAISLPAADPAAGRFGLRKTVSALQNGEIHLSLASDELKEWNADATQWYTLSGSGSLPDATSAPGGGTKGKVTFDSAKGIQVSSGIAEVRVDASTIEFGSGQLRIVALGVGSGHLAATSVTAAKLGSDVAGTGLQGGNGSAIAAKADVTGGANLARAISVTTNGLAVKIDDTTIGENGSSQVYVKNNGITATQINSSAVGNGLQGAGGTAISVKADVTGGANLAQAISVTGNGVAVKIDDTTIGANGSSQLIVKSSSVTSLQLEGATLVNANAGSIAAYKVVYIKSDGDFDLAKADVVGTAPDKNGAYAITLATVAAGDPGKLHVAHGVRVAGFSSLTKGASYYLSAASGGGLTTTPPSATGNVVTFIGQADSTTSLIFAPQHVTDVP